MTVSYAFRRRAFPSRAWSVPLSVDDGEVDAHFPEARDGATFPIEAQIDLSRRRARIFADPHAAPDRLAPIRLRQPEAEDPRA